MIAARWRRCGMPPMRRSTAACPAWRWTSSGRSLAMVNLKNAIWQRTNGPEAEVAAWQALLDRRTQRPGPLAHRGGRAQAARLCGRGLPHRRIQRRDAGGPADRARPGLGASAVCAGGAEMAPDSRGNDRRGRHGQSGALSLAGQL